MSSRTITIPTINVGTPSPAFQSQAVQQWQVTNVCFHGFENLPAARGDCVDSPQFTCFGHLWILKLYPGDSTGSDEGKVTVFLYNQSDESITVQFCFSAKDISGKEISYFAPYAERLFKRKDNWGSHTFAARTEIISALVEGALTIEVRMRRLNAAPSPPKPFIAENPLSKLILKIFMDEKSSDVTFEVSSGEAPPTTFYVHRLVLQTSSPWFAQLFESGEDFTKVSISDAKPDVFRHLLHYAYGGKVDDGDLKADSKDIIDAADKYGIVGLKLEAGAILVASTAITIDNAMELLLYADDKNCALLKEAVMDFLTENLHEGIKKLSFENVPGHMMKDLMTAMAREKTESDDGSDAADLSVARVSTLRKMLHEKGLDIDGSREAMIVLLEENA